MKRAPVGIHSDSIVSDMITLRIPTRYREMIFGVVLRCFEIDQLHHSVNLMRENIRQYLLLFLAGDHTDSCKNVLHRLKIITRRQIRGLKKSVIVALLAITHFQKDNGFSMDAYSYSIFKRLSKSMALRATLWRRWRFRTFLAFKGEEEDDFDLVGECEDTKTCLLRRCKVWRIDRLGGLPETPAP